MEGMTACERSEWTAFGARLNRNECVVSGGGSQGR